MMMTSSILKLFTPALLLNALLVIIKLPKSRKSSLVMLYKGNLFFLQEFAIFSHYLLHFLIFHSNTKRVVKCYVRVTRHLIALLDSIKVLYVDIKKQCKDHGNVFIMTPTVVNKYSGVIWMIRDAK